MPVTVSDTGSFCPRQELGVTIFIPVEDSKAPDDESLATEEIQAAMVDLIAAIGRHYAVEGADLRATPHWNKFMVGPDDDVQLVVTVTADA